MLLKINIYEVYNEIHYNGIKTIYYKLQHYSKEYYRDRYINERLLAYYGYKNETPILGKSAYYKYIYDNGPKEYINNIYNKSYSIDTIKYTETTDEAYEEYIKNGGIQFIKDELEYPNFQLLKSKEFVLYGKIDK